MPEAYQVLFIGGPYDGRLEVFHLQPMPFCKVAVLRKLEYSPDQSKRWEPDYVTYVCHTYSEGNRNFYVYTPEDMTMSYADVLSELILNYAGRRVAA